MNRKGQITIFIIIALVILGSLIAYFILRDSFTTGGIPSNMESLYTTFLACVEDDTLTGINLLESQAGYIFLPDLEMGSPYMPFSSQLNFLGSSIPYWYYVSGNNFQKEQIPSKQEMESQLESFIEDRIDNCIFDEYYDQGFEIVKGEPNANVNIKDKEVEVSLNMKLELSFEEESALIRNHNVVIKSNLGNLYDAAVGVYEYEQDTLFLEQYGLDTLRLYAPVDGVELNCSPLIWNAEDIFTDLKGAIEANTLTIKSSGGDYSLRGKDYEYFVVDIPVNADIRFLNSQNWPSTFEVEPSRGSLLIAEPVGNQPGLGILGFCYAPYHFVYDMKYSVLVQVFGGDEIFQFPLAVVIQGNNPRNALDTEAVGLEDSGLCEYKNVPVTVNVYDGKFNPIEAEISYECFGETCYIDKTSLTESSTNLFPQCVNGHLRISAEGFKDAEYVYTIMEEDTVEVILDRLYEINVDLKIDGKTYDGGAIISFVSEDYSETIVYPETNIVELSEGQYEIQVQVYRDSSLKLDAIQYEECVEVPQGGLGALFGLTEEKCFDVEIPEQTLSSALYAGGKENYYILNSKLENSDVIEINAQSLPPPTSVDQLQDNYILFEDKGLEVNFK